jgi:hypothetical protein
MRIRSLLCVVCLLCGSAFALDRNAFSFQKYDLELRVDPAAQAVSARGRITLRNESKEGQRELSLQISSSLQWRLIQWAGAGKPALQFIIQPYVSDIDHTGKLSEAVVTLPSAVPPQGTVELDVGYSGTIPADTTRLTHLGAPPGEAAHTDWDQVSRDFTAVRGVGYVAWYPVAMEAGNLTEGQLFAQLAEWKQREAQAAMRVRFCWIAEAAEDMPKDLQLSVLANGVLEGMNKQSAQATEADSSAATGCAAYLFAPLGETVPTFAIGRFEVLQRPVITVYHRLGHEQTAADYALAAEKVLSLTTEWFGAPQEKVRVVELNDASASPYESGAMLFTPLHKTDAQTLELVMTHQLVHVEFRSPRPWIYEGLAHFGQALACEQQEGRPAALAYMSLYLPALVAAEKQAAQSGQTLVNGYDEIYIRVKAVYVWWMLRDMLGDAVLQRVLKSYRPEQDREPSYLQRLVEAQSKRDLEWFFDDWVYRDRGLPDFKVDAVFPRQLLGGGWFVTITIENTGRAGAEVPVAARAGGGVVQKRLEVRAGAKAVTRIEMPAAPLEVIVNDSSVPEADLGNNRFRVKQP